MNQFTQDALKGLKDGAMGLIPMLVAVLFPQAGMPVQVGLFIAGAVVMVLGVITNTVQKDFGPVDTWGKVAKDTILGFCAAAVPIIQNGSQSGTVFVTILITLGIAALSTFANVYSVDVSPNSALAKIVKDFVVLGIGAIVPVFTTALSTGASIGISLGTAAIALLSVASNVIKTDLLTPTTPPTTAAKP